MERVPFDIRNWKDHANITEDYLRTMKWHPKLSPGLIGIFSKIFTTKEERISIKDVLEMPFFK